MGHGRQAVQNLAWIPIGVLESANHAGKGGLKIERLAQHCFPGFLLFGRQYGEQIGIEFYSGFKRGFEELFVVTL